MKPNQSVNSQTNQTRIISKDILEDKNGVNKTDLNYLTSN